MRRVVAWNVMTLDGYFEGAKPWDLDMHGTVWGDELQEFSLAQGEEIGTLLFGRRTYEGMRDYWTAEEGPIAAMMNGIDKAVASRTLAAADWSNTRLLKGEASETVQGAEGRGGQGRVRLRQRRPAGDADGRGAGGRIPVCAWRRWCGARERRCSSPGAGVRASRCARLGR